MRVFVGLALVVATVFACGGGAAEPVKVAPAVTQAPTAAPKTPLPTYYDGY